jgi:hypothetical protein
MTINGTQLTDTTVFLGRLCLHGGLLLADRPSIILLLTNGISRGMTLIEATQGIAKHVSTIIRDASTGLGANLTPALLAALVVQLKKGGLTVYATVAPVLTAVGSSGLLDLALTGVHLDTFGVSAINITGPGIVPNDDLFIDVIAVNKTDVVRGGMTALPNVVAAASGGLPTIGVTIPNATAGTSLGLALKQNVDDATAGVTTAVNSHTDTATSGVTTAVNSHTDTATSGVTTAVNSHTDTATSGVTTAVNSHTDAATSGIASAETVRDAVLNALMQDHATPGSVADGIAIASGLLQGNFLMDNVNNTDSNGQTAARIRLWRSSAALASATPGGTGEGEFAMFSVSTSYSSPGKILVHRVTRIA